MIDRYPYIELCFEVAGYNVKKDFDDIYLGIDRGLEKKATVSLSAYFQSRTEVQEFYKWWVDKTRRGVKPWMTELLYFGEEGTFVIEQTSPFSYKPDTEDVDSGIVSFEALILYDKNSIKNNVPVATPMVIHVAENSVDNYIKLNGTDKDNDPLDFAIEVPTAHGVVRGSPPAILYTPDHDFKGTDCLSFNVKDIFSTSKPALVEIVVDSTQLPDHVVKYTVSGPIMVNGNFHYDLGDGHWRRGFGGFLTPITDTITIASYDHELDPRDSDIDAVEIVSFGSRTNYDNYLRGKVVGSISVGSGAGICKGTSFVGTFEGVHTPTIPVGNLPEAVDVSRMFANSKIDYTPELQLPKALYLRELMKGAEIGRIIKVVTPEGLDFAFAFANMKGTKCIGYLDTRKQHDTTGLFDGTTTLLNPTAAEMTALEAGALHDNDNGCGVVVTDITQIGTAPTCQIGSLGASCDSTAQYKVAHHSGVGTLHFTWHVTGGVVTAGGDTDTVTVKVSSEHETSVTVYCEVKDDVATVQSPSRSFIHSRTYGFPVLILPKSNSQIDLGKFIHDQGHDSASEILIFNKVVNCSIKTGDLTGKTVKLVNSGTLEGFPKSRTSTNTPENSGLVYSGTGTVTIHNDGSIMGAGGYGGAGGKGADKTVSGIRYEERYSNSNDFWIASCALHNRVGLRWKGALVRVGVYNEGCHPTRLKGDDGNWYSRGKWHKQGSYPSSGTPKYKGDLYYIKREIPFTQTYIGGAGGLGGIGQGYNQNAKDGLDGYESNPVGGNSGGKGGTGGTWGAKGSDGADGEGGGDAGSHGYDGAPAVIGFSHFTWSKEGTILGAKQ